MRVSKCEKFLQSKCANCSLSFSKKNVKSMKVDYGSTSHTIFEVISYIYGISIDGLQDRLVSYFNNVVRNSPDSFLSSENETTISDFPANPGFVLCRKCVSVMSQMYKYHRIFNDMAENDSFISEILEKNANKPFELFNDVKSEPVELEFLIDKDGHVREILDTNNETIEFDSNENENLQLSNLSETGYVVQFENEECTRISNASDGNARITRKMASLSAAKENNNSSNCESDLSLVNEDDDLGKDSPGDISNEVGTSDSEYEPEPESNPKRKRSTISKQNSGDIQSKRLTRSFPPLARSCSSDENIVDFPEVNIHSENNFVCKICFEGFATHGKLKWHSLDHIEGPFEITKHVKGPPYTCPKCENSYKILRSLQFHAMRKHKAKVPNKLEHVSLGWDCDDCFLSFSDAEELKRHYEIVHSKKYFCKYCHVSFEEESSLLVHLEGVHKKINVDIQRYFKPNTGKKRQRTKSKGLKTPVQHYPCKKCHKVFSTPYKRKIHKLIHVEGVQLATEIVAGTPFICPQCSKSFKSFQCFDHHSINRHKLKYPSPVTSNCSKCNENFCNTADLEKHCRSIHGIEFFCKYCNKCYSTSAALQVHENSHEEMTNKYLDADVNISSVTQNLPDSLKCKFCEKFFETYKAAKIHEKSHADEERPPSVYLCPVCDRSFKTCQQLNQHKFTHAIPHICEKCGAAFSRLNKLLRHSKDHEEMENGIRPQCDVCEKTFLHSTSLQRHKTRFHTGKKKPECPLCHKGFSNPYNIRVHLKICKTTT